MRIIVLLIGLLSFVSLCAQSDFKPLQNSDNIKKEFENKTGNLVSMQCDFVQEKHLAYLSSTVISKGKFWFKKENKLRWEYIEPFKYLVVVNGDKITMKDENNTSVYNKKPNKTFQQLNAVLASSVNGTLINGSKYTFSVWQNSSHFLVELKPNDAEAKGLFSSIKLYFLKTNMAVNKIVMLEPNDDSITLTFEKNIINSTIKENMFIVE